MFCLFCLALVFRYLILLGNVAMRAGGQFKWNAKKMTTDRKDANKLISKAYRTQWGFEPA